jgi:hypothetical protein
MEAKKNSLKLTERRGNVYENKGPELKNQEQSRNLYENAGAYSRKARMLLKRKTVNRW